MQTFLILFIGFLPFSLLASTSAEVEEATKSIKSLIRPLTQQGTKDRPKELSDFRLDQCERHKINWMDVLTLKEKPTLKYTFKKGCDIEGTIEPRIFQTFPAQFKLKNLKLYNAISSQNKVTSTIESKPVLNLTITDGVLVGKKGKVKFEADYRVQIDPMTPKKPVEKNLGGEMRIKEIYGRKVSINEKIFVE